MPEIRRINNFTAQSFELNMDKVNGGKAQPTKAPPKKKKARPKTGKPIGRPPTLEFQNENQRREFWEKFDLWIMKGMDLTGCAVRVGVHHTTLNAFGEREGKWGEGTEFDSFSSYKADKRKIGNQVLEERQFDLAFGKLNKGGSKWLMRPDLGMLIWLGKNRLGQVDKVETPPEDIPEPFVFNLNIVTNDRPDKEG